MPMCPSVDYEEWWWSRGADGHCICTIGQAAAMKMGIVGAGGICGRDWWWTMVPVDDDCLRATIALPFCYLNLMRVNRY